MFKLLPCIIYGTRKEDFNSNEEKDFKFIHCSKITSGGICDITLKRFYSHQTYWSLSAERQRDSKTSLAHTHKRTKWCGSGTTANDYNELGNAWEEDQCCREHDHCSDVIPPERRKHNLLNDSAYTRTSCDCDDKFYRCLKKINSKTAYFIGVLYFNIYNAKCFKKDYKMTVCATKRTFFSKCKDYERDYSRPQLYQWFESPNF
ncbi:phospholipase A2-like [Pieris napi]|uniref:phospholipase A2-like n=1 Tax=Pieris napi TaxID=78633 RepID=UPI001FB9ED7F|nr:phospholipase A2-like [Pieris napi]